MPTRLRARLTNPNNFPISVNATFGIADFGLGLAFGPVGEVQNQVIPANSEGAVEVVWTPPVSGRPGPETTGRRREGWLKSKGGQGNASA